MTASEGAAAATVKLKVPIPANGVDYRGKVVLAPMVRSGELPSRLLALHYGADLVWGELLLGTSQSPVRRADSSIIQDPRPSTTQ